MDKNNSYILGMYEKAVPIDMSLKDKLIACKNGGFDFMELSIDETDEKISRLFWNNDERNLLRSAIEETNQPIYTICFSAQRKYSLGSIDLEKRNKAIDLMKRVIDFASYIGVRIVQLAGYDCYYEESSDESKKIFLTNLVKACEFASKKGVLLGFETMMDRTFIDTVEKAMKYVNYCDCAFLGVYPDIGNLSASKINNSYSKSLREDILSGKGHIFAAHLKETLPDKDRGVDFSKGITNYDECIKVLKEVGVRIFNAEFWHKDGSNYEDDLAHANSFLRKKLDEIFI